jgi:gamma-butyrobetaine hydroxylase
MGEGGGMAEIREKDGELELAVGGRVLRYPAVWLRDNCPCADCADPLSGQKLHDITDIAPNAAVAEVTVESDNSKKLTVAFTPDGHLGEFTVGWLLAHPLDGRAPDVDEQRLWDHPGDLDHAPAGWGRYIADPRERERTLAAVRRDGFALLTGVPADEGTVLAVAETFGFVRETNYGRLFDVRIEPAPGNLAFTSRQILPHTDNPYRDPVPTLQLLHCLRAADEGGDTGLVDGFAAARALHAADPEAYSVLTSTPVSFEFIDKQAELRTSQPLIQLSPDGRVRGVRFNNRSIRAIQLPYHEVTAFYAAYRRWAELLARPERRFASRLAPGDCLIFDNTRILHARTAFSVTGSRHLQGCYADMDGLLSTLAMMRRTALDDHDDRRTQPAVRRAGGGRIPRRAGDNRRAHAAGGCARRGGQGTGRAGRRRFAARRRAPARRDRRTARRAGSQLAERLVRAGSHRAGASARRGQTLSVRDRAGVLRRAVRGVKTDTRGSGRPAGRRRRPALRAGKARRGRGGRQEVGRPG